MPEGSLGEQSAGPASQKIQKVKPGFGDTETVFQSPAFVQSVLEEGEKAETCQNGREFQRVLTLQGEKGESSEVTDDDKSREGFA